MRGFFQYKRFLLLIIFSCGLNAFGQSVTVCPPELLDLESVLQSQLTSCGNDSYLSVSSSNIPEVPIGLYSGPAQIFDDGTVDVVIYNSANAECETVTLNIDLVQTDFTYSITGCHVLNITGPQNASGCTYTYTIDGESYSTQNPTGIQLPNGGNFDVDVTVNCGGCVQSNTYQIDVTGPEAILDFSSSEAFYFDPSFDSWVVCTSLTDAVVEILDISESISPGAVYDLEIISPSGGITTSGASPNPYNLTVDEEGLYTLNFTITSGACISSVTYQLFVSNPNVAVELSAPLTVEAYYCENETIELIVCSGNSCSNNPPGTLYTVEFTCSDYIYQTTTIPFTLDVPLSASSCSSSCSTGQCACDLIITANRPCVDALSSTYCPIKVSPQPDANFEMVPANPQNTYCVDETIGFNADWMGVDCNGPNPLPSLCENHNPLYTITPSSGWTLQSGTLDSENIQIAFNTPGSYEICYTAENSCGIEAIYCESVCILDDTSPTVVWNNSNIICVGEVVNPEIDFTAVACATTQIDWSSTDTEVSISNSNQSIPSVVFSAPGDFDLDISVSGLCNPFSEIETYQVCDAPGINLTQPVVNLCVSEPYCFGDLVSVVWNNCPGDVVWTIPGISGSPFLNPINTDLCISWDASQTVVIIIAATNECGTTTEEITVNIDASAACPINEPGEFCLGDVINIPLPDGGSAPTWYSSTDGINFTELVGGMPHSPTQTTWYYVESTVNGCYCLSDTVQAILVPEPVFTFEVSNTIPCPGEEITFFLSPAQGDVNWYDTGGTLIATQPEYSVTPTGPISITGELIYGGGAVQCSVSNALTATPVTNPIVLDCSSIPSIFCEGDPAQPLPSASPAGGSFNITNGAGVVVSNPANIDPTTLGMGSFYLVYEYTTPAPSLCTFLDSCQFTITAPQVPVITPSVDTLCYYSSVSFQENSGLAGTWSSSCPGAIDASGFFDPQAAGCAEGTVIEIYYTGDCIENQTFEVYLIPNEVFSITSSTLAPCPEESVSLSTNPLQDSVVWMDQDGNILGTDPILDIVFDSQTDVTATSSYGSSSIVCTESQTITVNPVSNPIVLDCSSIPSSFCEGDPAQPLPSVSPAGGSFNITNGAGVVVSNPANIDPTTLGMGSFYLVYEYTTPAPSLCTFLDSCQFTITAPQVPVITPSVDTLCYYSSVSFQENSGLAGAWSSSCPGAIDASGFFDPQAAGCAEGTVIEIYYTGDCIENQTFEVYLIPNEVFSIVASNPIPCPSDLVSFSLFPAQYQIIWKDENEDIIGTDQTFETIITETFEITAEVTYGSQSVVCESSSVLTISPEPNPINIDCDDLPILLCEGDPAIPMPNANPAGGDFYITDGTSVLFTNPIEIDPSLIDAGNYYAIYEVTGVGSSGCTFRDSCAFTIQTAETPNIQPNPLSICYNEPIQFEDLANLDGSWSSNCPGAISNDGFFNPQSAGCLQGSTVQVYYSGDCIVNDTLSIYLIPIPSINLDIPNTEVCANSCVTLDATIDGNFGLAQWTLTWGTESANFAVGETFCPDQIGINSDINVNAVLVVSTADDPICSVSESIVFNVIGIPNENFVIESPQCIAENISLPECDNCDSYNIEFTDTDGNEFSCQSPGGACNLPDTGIYQYEVIYDFGTCLSNPYFGEFHQIDAPFLEILSVNYDSCAPVPLYTTRHGGYDYDLVWDTYGELNSTTPIALDTFVTVINHNVEIQVDTTYTDVVTITNMCGTTSDTSTVYHMALPDFTIDPDSSVFCDNTPIPLVLGFAQPLHVDSILVNYFYQTEQNLILEEIPNEPLSFMFESGTDTLIINFTVTAFNPCGSITKDITVFVLPTDVSADIDIAAFSPACFGDTIPITINSTGNIDIEARTINSNNPLISVVEILGDWYIIPQEGSVDGNYTIMLTEYGYCGADVATATFEFGPTLTGGFQANDVCRGELVTFTPTISQDADLTWYFQPDIISNQDFPPPFLYASPGIYFPVLVAENPDYCPLIFSSPIEVYAPITPQIRCDASCDGLLGCKVDFSDEFICVSLRNADSFISYQWKVNGQFYPEYGEEIQIPIELIKPCENTIITLSAIDIRGCTSVLSEGIEFNDALIHIPNSFTPNEDGVNDVFKPIILGAPSDYLFQIFDRWGTLVFETTDTKGSWRGNEDGNSYYGQSEVYSYKISWKPCNRAEDKIKKITGHVTVVR